MIRFLLIFILIIVNSVKGYEGLDSIAINRINALKELNEKEFVDSVQSLWTYFNNYNIYHSPDISDAIITIAKSKSEEAYYQSIIHFWYTNRNRQRLLDSAITILKKRNEPEKLADLYVSKSYGFRENELYDSSMVYIIKARKIYEQLGNKFSLVGVYHTLGDLYYTAELLYKSEYYYNKALQLKSKTADWELWRELVIQNNLGLIEIAKGDYNKAEEYFNKSRQFREARLGDINSQNSHAYILRKLLDISIRKNDYKKAADLIKSLSNYSANNFIESGERAAINNLIASYYFRNNDINKAKFHNNKADSLALEKEIASKDKLNIYKLFAEIAYKEKDYKIAGDYLLRVVTLKDSINQVNRAANYLQILAEDDFEKFTHELELNKKELEALTIIGILISILLLILTIFYFYKIKQNKKLTKKNIEIERQKDLLEVQKNELDKINNELKQLYDERNKFFSIIAHDLRRPFTGILGYLDILVKEYDSIEENEKKEFIDQLHSTTYSLHHLLENLLNWASIQRKTIRNNPQKIKIINSLNRTILIFTENLRRKEIEIVATDFNDYEVLVDENHLDLIFRNLLSNAIKFSYRKSKIEIGSCRIDNSFVMIYIKDYGTGISQENIERLFKTNQQIESNKGTENERSSGLGLTLCRDFIETMGGTLSIESELNNGSKFIFTIPAAD
ncbi:MAG: hypothetical protein CMF23_09815 [Ignavibacteriae bacterium]|nr:hypothetical protein [Ignavibacteriota bacterium]